MSPLGTRNGRGGVVSGLAERRDATNTPAPTSPTAAERARSHAGSLRQRADRRRRRGTRATASTRAATFHMSSVAVRLPQHVRAFVQQRRERRPGRTRRRATAAADHPERERDRVPEPVGRVHLPEVGAQERRARAGPAPSPGPARKSGLTTPARPGCRRHSSAPTAEHRRVTAASRYVRRSRGGRTGWRTAG